jgi:hypothetical protein
VKSWLNNIQRRSIRQRFPWLCSTVWTIAWREQERIAESIRFVLSLGNTTAPDRLPMLVSTLSVLHGVLTDRIETGIELLP